jgi:hypothetical protein
MSVDRAIWFYTRHVYGFKAIDIDRDIKIHLNEFDLEEFMLRKQIIDQQIANTKTRAAHRAFTVRV